MLCTTVIPTVNRPSFEKAVKSALEQDLSTDQYEIIVVNDSGEPLPDYEWLRSPQIKIVNTNRCERSVAQTMGAAVGRGKYIKILQDDDYLLPGGLKSLVDLAESTGCYWAYGAANRVDNDDVFMSVNRPEVNGNLFAHSAVGDAFHLSASLIRRDIFFQVGGFDPTINTSEDIDLQWRVARLGEIRGTPDIVAGIRVGVWGGTTTNWSKKTRDTRIVRERALNSPGAFSKMWDSVRGDPNLRGRCCRAYMISGVLNLAGFRIPLAVSRFFFGLLLANVFVLLPKFWKGLLSRSHWHSHEKNKEEQHYLDLHPEQEIKSQKW